MVQNLIITSQLSIQYMPKQHKSLCTILHFEVPNSGSSFTPIELGSAIFWFNCDYGIEEPSRLSD